jgi:hypothetical protein
MTRLFHNTVDHPPGGLQKGMHLLRTNPNIYIIENWLTENEMLYLNKAITCKQASFSPSTTEESGHGVIVSSDRTSNSFHLTKAQDGVCRSIERRAAEMIGSHEHNSEPLQIVAYKDSQHFGLHHDAGFLDDEDHATLMPSPVRLITLFGYLNNVPEGMGETEFPWHPQPLKVTPKRGSVIVFCNVNADGSIDERVVHQANPVVSGIFKYGINMWVCEKSMQGYTNNQTSFHAGEITNFALNNSALFLAEQATTRFIQLNHTSARSVLLCAFILFNKNIVLHYFGFIVAAHRVKAVW